MPAEIRITNLAAIEFACLDLIGKAPGQPVHNLLGGKLAQSDGAITVPKVFGLGVPLAPAPVVRYAKLSEQRGCYPCDRDSRHPDGYVLVPRLHWADPADDRVPSPEL